MQCTVAQNVRCYGEEARATAFLQKGLAKNPKIRAAGMRKPFLLPSRYRALRRGALGLFTKRSGGKSENVVSEASIVDSAQIDKPCSPPSDRTER